MKKTIIILVVVLLWTCPVMAEDTLGINYHFSHADGTETRASDSFNPQGPGNAWSHTFDSGATLNSDGSWTVPLGDGSGKWISVRAAPVFVDD